MNDNEARGLILRKIYDLRNTGRFVNSGELNDLGFDRVGLDRYLTQLEQLNLVTMKALRDHSGLVDAMIQITPYGSNSIERPETAPSQIVIIQGDVQATPADPLAGNDDDADLRQEQTTAANRPRGTQKKDRPCFDVTR
jgi:hypothetical protein